MLYCEGYLINNPEMHLMPSVYKVKRIPSEITIDKLLIKTSKKEGFLVEDYKSVRDEFMEGLKGVVKAVFSMDEPFVMTKDLRNKCAFCPYSGLCMRQG
jgi:hypothetical protein